MKNCHKFKSVFFLFAASFLLQATVGTSETSARELRYATLQSPLNVNIKTGIKPYIERIKKRTNGSLSFRIFPSSQLLGARDALSGIEDGVAQAGFLVPVYQPNELPHIVALGNMATYGRDPLAVAAAVSEAILVTCPSCLRDYESHNAMPLVSYATTNYVLQCNRPVENRDDLKGLKVRSTGVFSPRFEALGAIPINIASSETAEALMRGQVDCVHASWDWLKGFGLQDGVTHIIDIPTGSYRGLGGFVINRDAWDDLSEQEREIMTYEAPALVADLMLGMMNEEDEARQWAIEKGIVVTNGSEELREALGGSAKDEEIVAKRAEALGVENYDELVRVFKASAAKWEGIIKDIGHDRDKYISALRREVYSRL